MRKTIKNILRNFYTFLAKKKVKSFGSNLKVNFYCKFNANTEIGNHCNFNGLAIHGHGKVKFGDYFHSGKEILIVNSNHKFDGANAIPYDTKAYIHKDVTIEDFVWIGTRVTILGGITIGEGSIIQSGAVVVKDVPKHAIVGGNPAQVFKTRNSAEFEKLKAEKKFW